ncbi:heavy-metal-associated domain-containing protein [Aliiroseovarius sp. F47248L]|uniref:heavy-metal-associated domain-containing protein n=1 Tax=Aliiroseovarius sp. F47248L TaxID=2926420 RepID=UPI001FF38B88|nr:heavy-metal-associated domain-containing protein [Aliiroseovarius sp. F47248L]MCK0137637.1 heavy-metal-associated domain-containing protein [Aliiroseovarius sp. F47248L]
MATFHMPDMSCGHCKASVTEALTQAGAEQLSFDMEARTVDVTGLASETVIAKLDEIGFPAVQK